MIADEVAQFLPSWRAEAESLMVDSCTIRRVTSTGDVDDDGNPVVTGPTVYAGRCKVQTYEPYEQNREVGSSSSVTQRYSIHVPVTAGPFEVGDVVTITASAEFPTTLNRTFRVEGLHEKTWQTAQRLLTDEPVAGVGR